MQLFKMFYEEFLTCFNIHLYKVFPVKFKAVCTSRAFSSKKKYKYLNIFRIY